VQQNQVIKEEKNNATKKEIRCAQDGKKENRFLPAFGQLKRDKEGCAESCCLQTQFSPFPLILLVLKDRHHTHIQRKRAFPFTNQPTNSFEI